MTAWLIREPRERGERLRPLCTDELLEGLVNTRPDKIVRWTPSGEPQLVMADASGGMVRQAFTNGRVIELRIVPNPQTGAPVVASVRPAE
ncbi:hypothetical protein CGZ98_03695 [Enemella evansiae]|nr:hypothetical protein CGZ98_03695 [Enemella evansiae]